MVSLPVAVYARGFPPGHEGQMSLVPVIALEAWYLLLGVGMWLVRPEPDHRVAYRVAFAFLHLQAAFHLLMWSQAHWGGGMPNVFRPWSIYGRAAILFTMLGFVPAFLLRKRARDWRLIFWLEIIVPFCVTAAVAFALIAWLLYTLS